jgi:hypothetical protein
VLVIHRLNRENLRRPPAPPVTRTQRLRGQSDQRAEWRRGKFFVVAHRDSKSSAPALATSLIRKVQKAIVTGANAASILARLCTSTAA